MIINALKLARQQSVLDGDMPMVDLLSRLTDDGRFDRTSQAGQVSFKLTFSQRRVDVDYQHNAVVIGLLLKCDPVLVCHSSDRLFTHSVQASSQVALLESDADGKALQEDIEAFICEPEKLDVAALLAEELLLSLPLVPRHPDVEPVEFISGDNSDETDDNAAAPVRENPFSVLQELQKK